MMDPDEFLGRFGHLSKSGWRLVEKRRDAQIHRQWRRYVARRNRFPHRQFPKPEWQQRKAAARHYPAQLELTAQMGKYGK